MDLGKYSFLIQHRPDESQVAIDQIAQRDYASFDLVRKGLQELRDVPETLHKIRLIHRKWEAIPFVRRNAAIQKFIETYLSGTTTSTDLQLSRKHMQP